MLVEERRRRLFGRIWRETSLGFREKNVFPINNVSAPLSISVPQKTAFSPYQTAFLQKTSFTHE